MNSSRTLVLAAAVLAAGPALAQCPPYPPARIRVDTLTPALQERFKEYRSPTSGTDIGALLETFWPGWHNNLPACPCAEPVNDRNWVDSSSTVGRYHPGAKSCYRSKDACAASRIYEQDGVLFGKNDYQPEHGQQCCYDPNGALITQGPAAGTPDFYAPAGLYPKSHVKYDVDPFNRLGWRAYARQWPPNKGDNCSIEISADSRVFTPTHMFVMKEQSLRITASGQVRWYHPLQLLRNRSLRPTGPEGFAGKADEVFYVEVPLPNAPIGSLIGWIGVDEPKPSPLLIGSATIVDPNELTPKERQGIKGLFFHIGANASVRIPLDGPLWLTVNDGVLNNNSGAFSVVIENPPR
jgi:hypothetical protein